MQGPPKWMEGSSGGFANEEPAAFRAALEPLPTWDVAACSTDNIDGAIPATAVGRTREHEWAQHTRALAGEKEEELFSGRLDLDGLNLALGDEESFAGAVDNSALRLSKLTGNPNVVWSARLSPSPASNPDGSGGNATLSHVIRVHRTGSVEVERAGETHTPGCDRSSYPGIVGAVRGRQEPLEWRETGPATARWAYEARRPRSPAPDTKKWESTVMAEEVAAYPSGDKVPRTHGYYEEEERFWRERSEGCPVRDGATGDGDTWATTRDTRTEALNIPKVDEALEGCHVQAKRDGARPNHAKPSINGRIARFDSSRDNANNEAHTGAPQGVRYRCGAHNVRRKSVSTAAGYLRGGAGVVLPEGYRCHAAGIDGRAPHCEGFLSEDANTDVAVAASAKKRVAISGRGGASRREGARAGEAQKRQEGTEYLLNNGRRASESFHARQQPQQRQPHAGGKATSAREDNLRARRKLEEKYDGCRLHRAEGEQRPLHYLRDAEKVLSGIFDSLEGGLPTDEIYAADSSRTEELPLAPLEERVSALSQQVAGLSRGKYSPPSQPEPSRNLGSRSPPLQGQPSPNRGSQAVQDHRRGHQSGAPVPERTFEAGNSQGELQSSPSSGDNYQQRMAENESCSDTGTTKVGRHGSDHRLPEGLEDRPKFADLERRWADGEYGEQGEEEEAAASRVAVLSKRLALRCLHVEQEYLRRERAQTRLFQDQLRGVRQAAQDVTRRVVRAERSRAKKQLEGALKDFEGKEKRLVTKGEETEGGWKKERDALAASGAAARSEVSKMKRLSREAAEAMQQDADETLERQRLDLQRGWAEEKGALRRASEDALRRAVEGKTRIEEEAALEARTAQDSFEAQIRSWKAKAEAAERRAAEERDRRRGLEAGAKSALAQEVEKARQTQEAVFRELRDKYEAERDAHAQEIERREEEHRAHILCFHKEKKDMAEEARRKWQQEMREARAEAIAKAEEAATRAAAERTEALRRLRLAHDAEMRKAARDILRLERELRRRQQSGSPIGMVARSKIANSALSPLQQRGCNIKADFSEADVSRSCLDGVDAEVGLMHISSISVSDTLTNAPARDSGRDVEKAQEPRGGVHHTIVEG